MRMVLSANKYLMSHHPDMLMLVNPDTERVQCVGAKCAASAIQGVTRALEWVSNHPVARTLGIRLDIETDAHNKPVLPKFAMKSYVGNFIKPFRQYQSQSVVINIPDVIDSIDRFNEKYDVNIESSYDQRLEPG